MLPPEGLAPSDQVYGGVPPAAMKSMVAAEATCAFCGCGDNGPATPAVTVMVTATGCDELPARSEAVMVSWCWPLDNAWVSTLNAPALSALPEPTSWLKAPSVMRM